MAISNRYSSLARSDLIVTEYRSPSTPCKRASGNSSNSLTAIQRSDQKLWPFRTVTQAWRDQTSSSPSIDRHPLHAKGHPETPVRVWPRSNGRIKIYGYFKPLLKPGVTRPQNHRVSIPHPPYGKAHPETPVTV